MLDSHLLQSCGKFLDVAFSPLDSLQAWYHDCLLCSMISHELKVHTNLLIQAKIAYELSITSLTNSYINLPPVLYDLQALYHKLD